MSITQNCTMYGIHTCTQGSLFCMTNYKNSCTDWGLFYYNTYIYPQAFPSFSSCYTVRCLFRWPSIKPSYQIQKLAPKAFERTTFCFRFIHTLSKVCTKCRKQTFHMKTSWKLLSSVLKLFHLFKQTLKICMCVVSYMCNLLDYILLNLNRCNCTQHSST